MGWQAVEDCRPVAANLAAIDPYSAFSRQCGITCGGCCGSKAGTATCMKREYPEAPLVGVGAIIIEENRVALVKRGHAPLEGKWSIPGGVLEVGETLRNA